MNMKTILFKKGSEINMLIKLKALRFIITIIVITFIYICMTSSPLDYPKHTDATAYLLMFLLAFQYYMKEIIDNIKKQRG